MCNPLTKEEKMTQLFAQPYDLSATGFYFETLEAYQQQATTLTNQYGDPVEEFEVQFIDGETIDAELFRAVGVHQGNIGQFFDACEDWDEYQKIVVIIACGECGYDIDWDTVDPDQFDVDWYEMDSLKELAEHFVNEGLLGEIPENLRFYIDYDAFARDLSADYSETCIAGKRLIYRCA